MLNFYPSSGKRPLSSMCPAIFVDSEGDVRLVIGAAGGTKISSSVAWASLNNLWLDDNIKEAIDARRIHHQLFPMKLEFEKGIVTVSILSSQMFHNNIIETCYSCLMVPYIFRNGYIIQNKIHTL